MAIQREYRKWHSSCLNREMELLVFGHAGARVLVLPARMGRFYDYENWRMVEALTPSIAAGNIQLFCVDSVDSESLYNSGITPQARIARHLEYEGYLLTEVLPFSRQINSNSFAIAHGCSLGAYHAANLVFRHPQHFGKLVALSGRYNVAAPVGHYRDLLDGWYNETVYYHTPSHFLPLLQDETILTHLRRIEIILAIGDADPLLQNNRDLAAVLRSKTVPVQLYEWEGEAHRPRIWRQMIGHYL